jgi:hypothetical protein
MDGESELCDSIYTKLTELVGGDPHMRRANRSLAPLPREKCEVVGDNMVVGFNSAQLLSWSHLQRMLSRTYPGVDVMYNNGVAEISVPLVDERNRQALVKPGAFLLHFLRLAIFVFVIALVAQFSVPQFNVFVWNYGVIRSWNYLVERAGWALSVFAQLLFKAKFSPK